MYHFISICISFNNFEVFETGFKWEMKVLLISHLSLNLHFNLQIKIPERESSSEMGLLNPL